MCSVERKWFSNNFSFQLHHSNKITNNCYIVNCRKDASTQKVHVRSSVALNDLLLLLIELESWPRLKDTKLAIHSKWAKWKFGRKRFSCDRVRNQNSFDRRNSAFVAGELSRATRSCAAENIDIEYRVWKFAYLNVLDVLVNILGNSSHRMHLRLITLNIPFAFHATSSTVFLAKFRWVGRRNWIRLSINILYDRRTENAGHNPRLHRFLVLSYQLSSSEKSFHVFVPCDLFVLRTISRTMLERLCVRNETFVSGLLCRKAISKSSGYSHFDWQKPE